MTQTPTPDSGVQWKRFWNSQRENIQVLFLA
ncbi:MAG: hypothetical protein RLZZ435_1470, partial [Cyanobacteriota bacterium]